MIRKPTFVQEAPIAVVLELTEFEARVLKSLLLASGASPSTASRVEMTCWNIAFALGSIGIVSNCAAKFVFQERSDGTYVV